MRGRCPVHWSEINEYPDEKGFWSVTNAADIREVSLDHETYSSERGGVTGLDHAIPIELARGMFIAQDPPKHDRLKMLFQKGFTPKRIAEHEGRIRGITEGVLDGVAGRGGCDLVTDVAQPVVSRVIGRPMVRPPSTIRGCPVMQLDSFESRKRAPYAISHPVPCRPAGSHPIRRGLAWEASRPSEVSINPG